MEKEIYLQGSWEFLLILQPSGICLVLISPLGYFSCKRLVFVLSCWIVLVFLPSHHKVFGATSVSDSIFYRYSRIFLLQQFGIFSFAFIWSLPSDIDVWSSPDLSLLLLDEMSIRGERIVFWRPSTNTNNICQKCFIEYKYQ